MSGLLLLALAPMPYGYYELLRLVSCAFFFYAGFVARNKDHSETSLVPWGFFGLAALFNPIFPVHLSREVWAPIDIGAAIFILANLKAVSPQPVS